MYINLNRISMKKEWIEPEMASMDVASGKDTVPEAFSGFES